MENYEDKIKEYKDAIFNKAQYNTRRSSLEGYSYNPDLDPMFEEKEYQNFHEYLEELLHIGLAQEKVAEIGFEFTPHQKNQRRWSVAQRDGKKFPIYRVYGCDGAGSLELFTFDEAMVVAERQEGDHLVYIDADSSCLYAAAVTDFSPLKLVPENEVEKLPALKMAPTVRDIQSDEYAEIRDAVLTKVIKESHKQVEGRNCELSIVTALLAHDLNQQSREQDWPAIFSSGRISKWLETSKLAHEWLNIRKLEFTWTLDHTGEMRTVYDYGYSDVDAKDVKYILTDADF